MEKLVHPRDLECPFKTDKNSALEAFLQVGRSLPISQASQRTEGGSQYSTEQLKPIAELTDRFNLAFGNFGDVGNNSGFAKELAALYELSLTILPNKRAYIKALETELSEFLEPEEKGGLPKEIILGVVQEIMQTHEATFELIVDRKLLHEFLVVLQKKSGPSTTNTQKAPRPARRRVRVMEDSDEDADAMDEGEAEDEVVEGDEGVVASQIPLESEADQAENELRQRWAQPDYVEERRLELAVLFQPDRNAINRSMDKIFERVRNKRGYSWSLVGKEIVDTPTDDSIQVGPVMEERIVQDPISRKNITVCAVRSSKCPSGHLYEEKSVRGAVITSSQRDAMRGFKCSYMGCVNFIKLDDLVPDEDYRRFLVRHALQEEAEL